MEYTSKRGELIIPEYGRNIQEMILYAKALPDREKRQRLIEKIVHLMMQMHPQNRSYEDYRDKMWRHVFHIAGYDLDVTPPSGLKPRPEDKKKKPEKIKYPEKEARFRHYGHNVQRLIAKAIEMEDGPKKDGFVQVIGSYMKLAYKTWNKEHYVSDDIILEDLETLSQGRLKVVEDASLDNLTRANLKRNANGTSAKVRTTGKLQQRDNGRDRTGQRQQQQQQRRRRKK